MLGRCWLSACSPHAVGCRWCVRPPSCAAAGAAAAPAPGARCSAVLPAWPVAATRLYPAPCDEDVAAGCGAAGPCARPPPAPLCAAGGCCCCCPRDCFAALLVAAAAEVEALRCRASATAWAEGSSTELDCAGTCVFGARHTQSDTSGRVCKRRLRHVNRSPGSLNEPGTSCISPRRTRRWPWPPTRCPAPRSTRPGGAAAGAGAGGGPPGPRAPAAAAPRARGPAARSGPP